MNVSLHWLWLNGSMAYPIYPWNFKFSSHRLKFIIVTKTTIKGMISYLRKIHKWYESSIAKGPTEKSPTTNCYWHVFNNWFPSSSSSLSTRCVLFFYFIGNELLCEPDQWSISLIRQLNNSIRIDIGISSLGNSKTFNACVWCVT